MAGCLELHPEVFSQACDRSFSNNIGKVLAAAEQWSSSGLCDAHSRQWLSTVEPLCKRHAPGSSSCTLYEGASYKQSAMFSSSEQPLFQCEHTATKNKDTRILQPLKCIYYIPFVLILCNSLGRLLHRKHNPCFLQLNLHTTWLLPHFFGNWHDGLLAPAKVQLTALLTFVGRFVVNGTQCERKCLQCSLAVLHSCRNNICNAWLGVALTGEHTTCSSLFLARQMPTQAAALLPLERLKCFSTMHSPCKDLKLKYMLYMLQARLLTDTED